MKAWHAADRRWMSGATMWTWRFRLAPRTGSISPEAAGTDPARLCNAVLRAPFPAILVPTVGLHEDAHTCRPLSEGDQTW
jgi:hypothetical protein